MVIAHPAPSPAGAGAARRSAGRRLLQATEPGEVLTAVKAAVHAGYRLIDCAAGYGNQVR
jgi:diketogulonate reductase-like aldo/keto reductase